MGIVESRGRLRRLLITALGIAAFLLSGCAEENATGASQSSSQSSARPVATSVDATGPAAETFTKVCSSCHETDGGGKAALGAPALTNLQSWYVERQLKHFREGIRGSHPEDTEGAMMAVNAKPLSDDYIAALASYVDQLPDARPAPTLDGDAARGKDHYLNICAACHGNNGLGNESLSAPALVGVDDWYLLRAYEKFRGGIRGSHAGDEYGVQMMRIAPVLKDQGLTEDVLTYVATLPLAE